LAQHGLPLGARELRAWPGARGGGLAAGIEGEAPHAAHGVPEQPPFVLIHVPAALKPRFEYYCARRAPA
ncbi:MAG: hypothetical protein M3Y79_01810, partial [Pseudomonadota bacterium]|nr:hypothetical protein [Pseudomonadota bacterium]